MKGYSHSLHQQQLLSQSLKTSGTQIFYRSSANNVYNRSVKLGVMLHLSALDPPDIRPVKSLSTVQSLKRFINQQNQKGFIQRDILMKFLAQCRKVRSALYESRNPDQSEDKVQLLGLVYDLIVSLVPKYIEQLTIRDCITICTINREFGINLQESFDVISLVLERALACNFVTSKDIYIILNILGNGNKLQPSSQLMNRYLQRFVDLLGTDLGDGADLQINIQYQYQIATVFWCIVRLKESCNDIPTDLMDKLDYYLSLMLNQSDSDPQHIRTACCSRYQIHSKLNLPMSTDLTRDVHSSLHDCAWHLKKTQQQMETLNTLTKLHATIPAQPDVIKFLSSNILFNSQIGAEFSLPQYAITMQSLVHNLHILDVDEPMIEQFTHRVVSEGDSISSDCMMTILDIYRSTSIEKSMATFEKHLKQGVDTCSDQPTDAATPPGPLHPVELNAQSDEYFDFYYRSKRLKSYSVPKHAQLVLQRSFYTNLYNYSPYHVHTFMRYILLLNWRVQRDTTRSVERYFQLHRTSLTIQDIARTLDVLGLQLRLATSEYNSTHFGGVIADSELHTMEKDMDQILSGNAVEHVEEHAQPGSFGGWGVRAADAGPREGRREQEGQVSKPQRELVESLFHEMTYKITDEVDAGTLLSLMRATCSLQTLYYPNEGQRKLLCYAITQNLHMFQGEELARCNELLWQLESTGTQCTWFPNEAWLKAYIDSSVVVCSKLQKKLEEDGRFGEIDNVSRAWSSLAQLQQCAV